MTMAQKNTNITRSTIDFVKENFGDNIHVFDTVIPYGVKSSEAQILGKKHLFKLQRKQDSRCLQKIYQTRSSKGTRSWQKLPKNDKGVMI